MYQHPHRTLAVWNYLSSYRFTLYRRLLYTHMHLTVWSYPSLTHASHCVNLPSTTHASHRVILPLFTHVSHCVNLPSITHASHRVIFPSPTHVSHCVNLPSITHASHRVILPSPTHVSHCVNTHSPHRTHVVWSYLLHTWPTLCELPFCTNSILISTLTFPFNHIPHL